MLNCKENSSESAPYDAADYEFAPRLESPRNTRYIDGFPFVGDLELSFVCSIRRVLVKN